MGQPKENVIVITSATGHDPMIFLLSDSVNNKKCLWTYYWIKNRNGKWANGQFPPLFYLEEIKGIIANFQVKTLPKNITNGRIIQLR